MLNTVLVGEVYDVLVHLHAAFDHCSHPIHFSSEYADCSLRQCLLRPAGKPVDAGAVDQRREQPQSLAELPTYGRHTDHHMHVLLALLHQLLVLLQGCALILDGLQHFRSDIASDKSRNFASVQQIGDVFEDILSGDLPVVHDEGCRPFVDTGYLHHLQYFLLPIGLEHLSLAAEANVDGQLADRFSA